MTSPAVIPKVSLVEKGLLLKKPSPFFRFPFTLDTDIQFM